MKREFLMNSKSIRKNLNVGLTISLITSCILLWLPEISNALETDLGKMIEGAKKEGEVTYYNSIGMEDANTMIRKFENKYPFLKVKPNRTGYEKFLTKVTAEAQAKKYLADVIQTVGFGMNTIRKVGIIEKYVSPEDRFFHEEFKEKGYWITNYYNAYVIVYNTKLVPKG